jgi:DNA polymerase-1
MTTALVDGDVVLYEITFASEEAWDWGNDLWTLHSDFRTAKQRFDCWITNLQERLQADRVIIALSDKNNWRKEVLPSYKANRKSKRKPVTFPRLRQYAEDVYETVCWPALEADDVLGILATGRDDDCIIVTIDKDLMTVPGRHYYFNKETEDGVDIIEVTQEQADYNHLLQALTGDAVDGYFGCPGIGPVRADRLLKEHPTWGTVVAAYEKAGMTEEEALVQARVARILRNAEYTRKTGEVILWTPKEATDEQD